MNFSLNVIFLSLHFKKRSKTGSFGASGFALILLFKKVAKRERERETTFFSFLWPTLKSWIKQAVLRTILASPVGLPASNSSLLRLRLEAQDGLRPNVACRQIVRDFVPRLVSCRRPEERRGPSVGNDSSSLRSSPPTTSATRSLLLVVIAEGRRPPNDDGGGPLAGSEAARRGRESAKLEKQIIHRSREIRSIYKTRAEIYIPGAEK